MAALLAIADTDVPERSRRADRRLRGRRSLWPPRRARGMAHTFPHGIRYSAAGFHAAAEGHLDSSAPDTQREPDPLLRYQSGKGNAGSLRPAPQDAAPEPEAHRR